MSEIAQAIEEMRNMRESYDQLSSAAEAYNTGKVELAENITAKGVQASASETLPELAEKVSAIAQESYTIDGGEMYAKQLFGVANDDIVPGYWNLYDIMAQLLSDGRLVNYGGILLAEYYKGYDSLALAGAGAGGAYVVSDKDANGNFIMYTEDITHVWDTKEDGKGNRWVAYCFAEEWHDFNITDTNTSPRSIHVGRNVGTIKCLVNNRIGDIVVTDGNKLRNFLINGYTNNLGRKTIIKNMVSFGGSMAFNPTTSQCELLYLQSESFLTGGFDGMIKNANGYIKTIILDGNLCPGGRLYYGNSSHTGIILILKLKKILYSNDYNSTTISGYSNPLTILGFEEGTLSCYSGSPSSIYIGYDTNDKTKSITILQALGTLRATDITLQDGWCKPINLANATALTKENVQAHIFDRLGVNDISTGAVTLTLANAVLNLFTSEEIDAVVERTNITIVGA